MTAVHVRPGTTLQDGMPLYDVDGRTVVALQSSRPLHRDVGRDADSEETRLSPVRWWK
ncbi:hypothetical protein DVS28_a2924 [Euzebya pacifica]|uniref:Uncharacterized protein n=1 Tax=Euzebya pacifica TaxID=1608957 RepID=A0A346XZF6_9ACTN|nr:hypothetical protein DVS28_a2924 [Euzebya pacifica]